MKISTLLLLVLTLTGSVAAQDSSAHFTAFRNLIGSRWQGSGAWIDGTPFKQEVVLSQSLKGKLIKVQTYGNVSTSGFEFGLRNEGIRAWDDAESRIGFWEFDIFGGITRGYCSVEGNNIYYHYDYDTGSEIIKMTDGWIYKDLNTYALKVGVFEDGKWTAVYLDTTMKRK